MDDAKFLHTGENPLAISMITYRTLNTEQMDLLTIVDRYNIYKYIYIYIYRILNSAKLILMHRS